MPKQTLFAALFATSILAFGSHAQTLTQARTDVYYDSGSNTVYQISTASVDYNTQYYYDLQISSYLRKNGFTASFGSGDSGGGSVASTYASAPAEDGSFFDTYSYYYLQTLYQTYEVDGGCPYCYDWYDPFDYSFISQTGDASSSGPTYSVWVWVPPIVIVRTFSNSIQLGTSGGAGALPGPRNIFDVKLRAFIPPKWVWGPDTCNTGMTVKSTIYHGDGRSYNPYTWDVRAHSEVMLAASLGGAVPNTYYNYTGFSKRYASDALLGDGSLKEDSVLHDCYLLDNTGFAPTSDMQISAGGHPSQNVAVTFSGGASDPVASVPAPATNWNVFVNISVTNPAFPAYSVDYTHDCYPAFELYVGSQLIYGFTPSGNDPYVNIAPCLLGLGQISGQTIGTVF